MEIIAIVIVVLAAVYIVFKIGKAVGMAIEQSIAIKAMMDVSEKIHVAMDKAKITDEQKDTINASLMEELRK